jgi:hypothetical protein
LLRSILILTSSLCLNFTIGFKSYTVKPRCMVFKGDGKQKRYIGENNSTGKPLKIIDKNNLMIIITSC